MLPAALLYQFIGQRLDARRFPPPGRLVNVAGCRLHLHPQGDGEPMVVLEAGIAGSSLGWAAVQPTIAAFTRVCSYDRAGLGWSHFGCGKRTVPHMLAELNALLEHPGAPPPYLFVGHSFGGLLVRAYAARNPQAVAGLILLDPVSVIHWASATDGELKRLALGAKLARRGAFLARFGVVRAALTLLVAGNTWLPKLIAKLSAGKGAGTTARLTGEISQLPPAIWPAICAHWSNPKCFRALADYLQALPANALSAANDRVPASIPVTILSAATATPSELAERDRWVAESSCGRHIRLAKSGHWVQLEDPTAVVEAVRDMWRSTTAPSC